MNAGTPPTHQSPQAAQQPQNCRSLQRSGLASRGSVARHLHAAYGQPQLCGVCYQPVALAAVGVFFMLILNITLHLVRAYLWA
eukprot:13163-Amphidinium_carterae.1